MFFISFISFRNMESVMASINVDFDAETVAAKLAAYTGLRRIPGPKISVSSLNSLNLFIVILIN